MTTSRVQLALNVSDIEAATAFYQDLFGVEPAKQPARLRQLRDRRPAAQAGSVREPRRRVPAEPPRRRGPVIRRCRRCGRHGSPAPGCGTR